MISRLLALIAMPIIAYFIAQSASKRFSLTPRQNRILFGIIAALLVVLILVAFRRAPIQLILAPLGAAAVFLMRMLPMFLRLFPMWQLIKSRSAAAKPRQRGQTSTIRTEYLVMELQHDTGEMDGFVLKGNYAQQRLVDLSLKELLMLYGECNEDADSIHVLEAYLDRQHPGWTEQVSRSNKYQQTADDSVMTRDLAIEILGLSESTSKEEVVKAHRQLMQGLHPDRGGSDYLAKKINMAKDYLLKELQ